MFVRRATYAIAATLVVFTGLAVSTPAVWGQEANLRGTLRIGREPVEGIELGVTDTSGAEVGSATTDADGKWQIPITSTGEFVVTLDLSSLPEGVTLKDGSSESITVAVDELRNKSVGFKLVDGEASTTLAIDPLWQRVLDRGFDGIKVGLLMALAAVGLSLIYGVTGLVNFAHSEMVTFGAVMTFAFEALFDGLPFWIVVIFGALSGAALGYALESGLFRPLRKRKMSNISLMIVSIGLALIMRYLILIYFGSAPESYEHYRIQTEIDVGPFSAPPKDFVLMLLAFILLVAVGLLLQRTRLGTAMRAVSDNPALSQSSGIDVDKTIMAVWIAGSLLAAIGGTFLGLTQVVEWQMGEKVLLLIFAAVTLGGLGTAYGAMVGGLAIGFASEFSTILPGFDSDLKFLIALVVLIVILMVRPQGILGVRERFG